LEFNVLFQHKYGYIRDKTFSVTLLPKIIVIVCQDYSKSKVGRF